MNSEESQFDSDDEISSLTEEEVDTKPDIRFGVKPNFEIYPNVKTLSQKIRWGNFLIVLIYFT